MSNYTKLTDFASKDSLPSGNAAKIVKGTEINDEFVAIASAVATKADLASPALSGTPTAPTASASTNTTQIATTAFVQTELADYAPLDSAALTGTPTAPTATTGTDTTQVATTAFVQDALGTISAIPSGAVMSFAMNTAPTGWLDCDGLAVSRTTYADLFAAIGTTFGAGDGSTTFNLPDLRGEFVRGWDDGRGVDSGRTFGSAQADELKAHTHTYLTRGGSSGNYWDNGNRADATGTSGSTGGTETRPRNIALLYCIKV